MYVCTSFPTVWNKSSLLDYRRSSQNGIQSSMVPGHHRCAHLEERPCKRRDSSLCVIVVSTFSFRSVPTTLQPHSFLLAARQPTVLSLSRHSLDLLVVARVVSPHHSRVEAQVRPQREHYHSLHFQLHYDMLHECPLSVDHLAHIK